jgi:hypothetical protein
MARRHAGKTSPRIAARGRAGRDKAKAATPDGVQRDRVAALERERDSLRQALEEERETSRRLQQANAAARDRIAWALDTLRSVLDSAD